MGQTTRERMTSTYNPVNYTGTPLNASVAAPKHVGLTMRERMTSTYNPVNNTGTPLNASVAAPKHVGLTMRERMTSSYNPVSNTGTPLNAPGAAAKRVGLKLSATAAAAGNLHGSACIPKEGDPATDHKAGSKPVMLLHLPVRIDHLQGGGCVPGSSRGQLGHGSSSGSSSGDSSLPGSFSDRRAAAQTANKAKVLTLRAAVDHLHGGACAVRHVDTVTTLDAPPPGVSRGMATRLVRDKQLAHAAQEHMMSSCLYQPGEGYTKVVSGESNGSPQQQGP